MRKKVREELKRWSKDLVTGELRDGIGEFMVKADNVWFAKDVILAMLDYEEIRHEYMFNKYKKKPISIDCERAIAKKEDAESCKVYYLEASDDGVPPDRKRVHIAQIAEHKKPTKTAAKKTSRKAGK